MSKKNLIWLGLGAVALYLYFISKPKATAVTPVEPKKITPSPSNKPNQVGKKKYRVIKKLEGGGYQYIKGKMVAANDLYPKVGDIIELDDAKETYIYNKWLIGHSYTYAITDNGEAKMFIESSYVQKI